MELKINEEHDIDYKKEIDSSVSGHQTAQPGNPKVAKILDSCKWKDQEALRALAISEDGLISDDLRRQAC
jgi:hypothetical protein